VSGDERRPNAWVLAATALALLASCGGIDDRPDVVVVLIDTLRPDYLGFYGNPSETAPFLADLAESSAVMKRAYAASSWTAPSTASLFTSWYPPRHGVVQGFFAHKANAERVERDGSAQLRLNRLPDGHPTLPQFFRAAGYRTFGLASNINIGEEIGFARGFDRFERRQEASVERLGEVLDTWMVEDDDTRPRLIYLHLNDVHGPYTAREPWYEPRADPREDKVARYQGEIGYVDDGLRRMFERHGWADTDTIVAVVSDHGQEFYDHGRHGHRFRLYRELVQVLALIHAPAHGVAAREVHGNVSLLDLLPTLAELAGLEALPEWEGRSLAPVLQGTEDPAVHGRYFFSHRASTKLGRARQMWSVVHGDWHLIQSDSHFELFDLARDPAERNNLAGQLPDVVIELSSKLAEFRAGKYDDSGSSKIDVEIDEERLKALKALGYVD